MKTIRTLIVDDEPLARQRLVNLMAKRTDVKLVAECKNGSEAVAAIKTLKPDLLFLDIQMPDMDGFEVIEQIDPKQVPQIIFVTAYDQFALKAFDVHAIDYLLKPYDEERFTEALDIATKQIYLSDNEVFSKKLTHLLNEYHYFEEEGKEGIQYLEIKEKGRKIKISTEHVICFEAYGNYIKVHLSDRNYLYRAALNAIQKQLPLNLYLRIHRSFLINTNYIQHTHYLGNNEYKFQMNNDLQFSSGRTYKENIVKYLNKKDFFDKV